jgi:hypothetical protein
MLKPLNQLWFKSGGLIPGHDVDAGRWPARAAARASEGFSILAYLAPSGQLWLIFKRTSEKPDMSRNQNVAIRLRWGDLAIRAIPDASQRSYRPPGAVIIPLAELPRCSEQSPPPLRFQSCRPMASISSSTKLSLTRSETRKLSAA